MRLARIQPVTSWATLALYVCLIVGGAGNFKLCYSADGGVALEPVGRHCSEDAAGQTTEEPSSPVTACQSSPCVDVLLQARMDAAPGAVCRASVSSLICVGAVPPVIPVDPPGLGSDPRDRMPFGLEPPCSRAIHLRCVVLLV